MIQESFPSSAFINPAPHPEFQGDVNSCRAFGFTSAIEAIFARAGNPIQLSPRYLWYYMDPLNPSLEAVAETINRVGICEEKYCPYIVSDLAVPPSFAAISSAQSLGIKVSVELIAGGEEIKRSICTGHSVVSIRVIGGSVEHCECIIGYDHMGAQVHGSGNTVYFDGFDAFSQTQKLTVLNIPSVPFESYVPPELPRFSFEDRTLYIPRIYVYPGFPNAGAYKYNAKCVFDADNYGTIAINQPDIKDTATIHNIPSKRVTLYAIDVAGVIYRNVTFTNSGFRIL